MTDLSTHQHDLIADYIDQNTDGDDKQYLNRLIETDSSFRSEFMDVVVGKLLMDALRIDIEGNI